MLTKYCYQIQALVTLFFGRSVSCNSRCGALSHPQVTNKLLAKCASHPAAEVAEAMLSCAVALLPGEFSAQPTGRSHAQLLEE